MRNEPRISRRRALIAAGLAAASAGRVGVRAGVAGSTFEAPSGYGVSFSHSESDLIGDLLSTERGDPKLEASVPHGEWYSKEALRRFGAWGPSPRAYPPLPGLERRSTEWRRERVIAQALRFVGYGYQHHHVPDWHPSAEWPWKETCAGSNGKGFDCSNFTSFVYNQGFGIRLNSDVVKQSRLEEALYGPHGREVRVRRVELPEGYDERIKALRTGDLLYILGKPGGEVTHVVLWVGPIGRSSSGVPLLLDSHGGGVNDDQGRSIPCGVQLRPFREKSWYSRCASHAHRLFGDEA